MSNPSPDNTKTTRLTRRETLPYRACAGVVVFNRQGQVFIGRRKGMASPHDAAWQFPQGGINKGEPPQDAALRELFEETSIHSVKLIATAPDWIFYDLPEHLLGKALKGKYRGQKQKWFACLFEGNETEINVLTPGGSKKNAEFDAWKWEDLERVPDLIVSFKRAAYDEIVAAFRPVAHELTAAPQD